MTRKRTSENDLAVSGAAPAAPGRRKPAARPHAKRAANALEPLASASGERETIAPQADAAVTPVVQSSYEEIAALAYSYWEARGRQDGCPEEDWLRAEQELRHRSVSVAIA
jgi:hypothetical protein